MKIYCKGYGLNCKDCKKEKCIDFRGKAEDRKLVFPAIYKHWKGQNYASINVAKPLDKERYCNIIYAKRMTAIHTETKEKILIKVVGNGEVYYLSNKNNDEELVLYKTLYDDSGIYARPKPMFLSEVPEGRESENETGQKYRFELVRY